MKEPDHRRAIIFFFYKLFFERLIIIEGSPAVCPGFVYNNYLCTEYPD